MEREVGVGCAGEERWGAKEATRRKYLTWLWSLYYVPEVNTSRLTEWSLLRQHTDEIHVPGNQLGAPTCAQQRVIWMKRPKEKERKRKKKAFTRWVGTCDEVRTRILKNSRLCQSSQQMSFPLPVQAHEWWKNQETRTPHHDNYMYARHSYILKVRFSGLIAMNRIYNGCHICLPFKTIHLIPWDLN